jgi:hypothetical protein
MKLLLFLFPLLILLHSCSTSKINYNSLINDDRIRKLSYNDDKIFLYEYTDDYIFWGVDTLKGVTTNADSINVSYPYSHSTTFYFKIISDSLHIIQELIDTNSDSQILVDDVFKKGNYGIVLNSNYFDSGLYWLKSIYGENKPVLKKFILLK